jgi:hypothetical protein
MKNKINIESLSKNNPFTIPDDYFTNLTHNIMDRIETPKQTSTLSFFQLKTLAPVLAIFAVIFSGVWYNNQHLEITDEELIEVLAYYEFDNDLLYEYIELEEEIQVDDYLIDHFNYNDLINEL